MRTGAIRGCKTPFLHNSTPPKPRETPLASNWLEHGMHAACRKQEGPATFFFSMRTWIPLIFCPFRRCRAHDAREASQFCPWGTGSRGSHVDVARKTVEKNRIYLSVSGGAAKRRGPDSPPVRLLLRITTPSQTISHLMWSWIRSASFRKPHWKSLRSSERLPGALSRLRPRQV